MWKRLMWPFYWHLVIFEDASYAYRKWAWFSWKYLSNRGEGTYSSPKSVNNFCKTSRYKAECAFLQYQKETLMDTGKRVAD